MSKLLNKSYYVKLSTKWGGLVKKVQNLVHTVLETVKANGAGTVFGLIHWIKLPGYRDETVL